MAPVASASVHSEELAKGVAFAQERAEREARLQRPLFVKPTKGIFTSGFGYRWGALHAGIDIANSIGTPIYAVADGVVTDAGPTAGYGAWVKIRHADGTVTLYGHVNTWLVSVGQRVMAGDQIATIGNRGNSTGPHCHFSVLLNGTDFIDPLPWLAQRGSQRRHLRRLTGDPATLRTPSRTAVRRADSHHPASPRPGRFPHPEPDDTRTGIIRRAPTGPVPVAPTGPTSRRPTPGPFPRRHRAPPAAPPEEPATTAIPRPPRSAPVTPPGGTTAIAACVVAMLSGWATSVVATDLITGWWDTDRLFCVAVGFLALVFAASTISGVVLLLLRRNVGRYLIAVGAVVALLAFGGVFIAGADDPLDRLHDAGAAGRQRGAGAACRRPRRWARPR